MEKSSDKTKRKIISELSRDIYLYRTVIFFYDYTPNIFDYASEIRSKVSRKLKCRIFWLVRVRNIPIEYLDEIPDDYLKKTITQPYLQFFTEKRVDVDLINSALDNIDLSFQINRSWSFPQQRKSRWLDTLKKQKLANLTPFHKSSKVKGKRWAITNKIIKLHD